MPAHLMGFDFAAQQCQPQCRVKLPMEEETLVAIGLSTGYNRHRQAFLVRMTFKVQLGERP
ncbi:hypothetical protein D3C80_1256250 [compost metagenome]